MPDLVPFRCTHCNHTGQMQRVDVFDHPCPRCGRYRTIERLGAETHMNGGGKVSERRYWKVMMYECDRCGHAVEFYLEDGCEGPRDREVPVPPEWEAIRDRSPVRDQLPETVPQTASGRYVLPVPFVAAGCPKCQGPPPWSMRAGVLQHARWQDDRDVDTTTPPEGAGRFHYPEDWFADQACGHPVMPEAVSR